MEEKPNVKQMANVLLQLRETQKQNEHRARLQRGLDIAQKKDQIVQFTSTRYAVKSQKTREYEYDVLLTRIGWICSCRDHMFRGVVCKHIYAILFGHDCHVEKTAENEVEEEMNLA